MIKKLIYWATKKLEKRPPTSDEELVLKIQKQYLDLNRLLTDAYDSGLACEIKVDFDFDRIARQGYGTYIAIANFRKITKL